MSAQACALASQQLWPPATLVTMRESRGEASVTTLFAAAYARLMSSWRTNCGACPPAPWHWPHRLLALRLSHTLILKDCTSAVAGAGPL
jgi:hypothetical protein